MPPESTSGGGPRITGGRKTIVLGIAFLSLAVICIVLFSHQRLYQIYCLRQERARLERDNARLAEENNRLARTIDRLHHDPEMIQDLIRQELNFVKKNEVIIQLPGADGAKPIMGAVLPPQTSTPTKKQAVSTGPRPKVQTGARPPGKTP